MELVAALAVLVLAVAAFEYRIRKPDQIVLAESDRGITVRRARFYPRHFSLALHRTTHTLPLTVSAAAKGNLEVTVKLSATVAAASEHLGALMRVGGWHADAVSRAAKELESVLIGLVKEHCEQFEIQQLSSQKIREYLQARVPAAQATLGIDVLSLTILSFEPADARITEALRQQEVARIGEQTAQLTQKARVADMRATVQAEGEIAALEHGLALKRFDLKQEELERESRIASIRVEEELKRNRKQLAFDAEELALLRKNPELLILTPQAARLAEASQGLRNARTVVSLSPQDVARGSELLSMFQEFLRSALGAARTGKKNEKS